MSGARRRILGLVAVLTCGLVVASGCSVYDVPLPGGADVGDNPITVHVEFHDVLDLVPQSTVKVDDVTVGRVSDVQLKGYHADVTLTLPHDIDLPDNARAEIRQTSLLGEKFVSLSEPVDEPATGELGNGDVIPLSRTGRNPEVEEVLGALSLLLNGGGVGQLKTISEELNDAFGGRESQVRSVLDQLHLFMGQLDDHRADIVHAIDALNRLAVQLKTQDGAIKSALDNLPAALKSIDSQRADLVKMLKALDRLSGVGVRVIQASKVSTINSLRSLSPVLDKLAEAGQNLPNSLQVFLTYPFVDAAIGRDPQVARNLHMGDYTNLSARLDINVTALPTPELPSVTVPTIICTTLAQITKRAQQAANAVVDPLPNPPFTKARKNAIKKEIVDRLVRESRGQCKKPDVNALTQAASNMLKAVIKALFPHLGQLPHLPTPSLPGLPGGGGLPHLPGLPRSGTAFDRAVDPGRVDVLNGPAGSADQLGYNSTLAALLLQGVKG